MTVTREELITEARRWLGTPYHHQGRSRSGFDCVGYVIWVAAQLKILPREFERTNYGRMPQPELMEKVSTYCTQTEAAEPGCLVMIRWPGETRASHCALCTGPTLLHTYQGPQQVVEHGYRGRWLTLTESTWRLPGVNYG